MTTPAGVKARWVKLSFGEMYARSGVWLGTIQTAEATVLGLALGMDVYKSYPSVEAAKAEIEAIAALEGLL